MSRYRAVVYDTGGDVIAVLDNIEAGSLQERLNTATSASFRIPREDPKQLHLEANNLVVIYRGDQVYFTGRISQRSREDLTWSIECAGHAQSLAHMMTPGRWERWNGQDLADVARDIARWFRTRRYTAQAQWQTAHAWHQIDWDEDPGSVFLEYVENPEDPENEMPLSEGWIQFRVDLGANALPGGRIARWSEVVGEETRITIQSRAAASAGGLDATPWGPEMTAVHVDEVQQNETVGVDLASGGRWLDVRVNLYTDDTETRHREGDEIIGYGFTPELRGLEVIWREPSGIVEGDIPASTGITVADFEFRTTTHLRALVELCDEYDVEFDVRHDPSSGAIVLDLGADNGTWDPRIGAERTHATDDPIVLRGGSTMAIAVARDDTSRLYNVLHCWGEGSGADQLYVRVEDAGSIAEYGERHGDFVVQDVDSLAELETRGLAELAERASPDLTFQVSDRLPGHDLARLGDRITIVHPRYDLLSAARVDERIISWSRTDERIELGLNDWVHNPLEAIMSRPARHRVFPGRLDSPRQVTAEGMYRAIRLRWQPTEGTSYAVRHRPEPGGSWRVLRAVKGAELVHYGLTPGDVHSYQVAAVRGSAISPWSRTATAEVSGDPAHSIQVPGPTGATAAEDSFVDDDGVQHLRVALSWDAMYHAELYGFLVRRAVSGTDAWVTIAQAGPGQFGIIDAHDLELDATYDYEVYALNRALVWSETASTDSVQIQGISGLVLAAPSGLSATETSGVGPDSEVVLRVALTWTPGDSAFLFEHLIERRIGVGDWAVVGHGGPAGSYTDTHDLEAGTTYEYRVAGRTQSRRQSPWSTTDTVAVTGSVTDLELDAPTALGATMTNFPGIDGLPTLRVSLSWTATTQARLAGHLIERSVTGTDNWHTLAFIGTENSYDDTLGIVVGVDYTYRVYSRTQLNRLSAPAATSIVITDVVTDLDLPAPENLQLAETTYMDADGDGTIVPRVAVSWDPVAHDYMTGYVLEREIRLSGNWIASEVLADQTSYSDVHGLVVGETYRYRVYSRSATRRSAPSATADITIMGDAIGPGTPSDLIYVLGGDSYVRLHWTHSPPKDFAHYEVQVDTSDTFPSPDVYQTTDRMYVLTNLYVDQTVYARVRAVDRSGNESDWTNTVEISMPDLLENIISGVYAAKEGFDLLLDHHFYGDPDDELDGSNIRANTVQAEAMAIGAASRAYQVYGMEFNANTDDVEARFSNTAGVLVLITTSGEDSRAWNISATTANMARNRTYYVYARCNRASPFNGTIQFSETRKDAEDATYHWFLLGMLFTKTAGNPAVLALSFGWTVIDGGHITTGTLDASKVRVVGGIGNVEIDGNGIVVRRGEETTFSADGSGNVSIKGQLAIESGSSGIAEFADAGTMATKSEVDSADVTFDYAGSDSKGGDANDVINVAGTSATTVRNNANDGRTAFTGTTKYRTTGAPTNNPSSLQTPTVALNKDGSANIRLEWTYSQGARQADVLVLFWKKQDAPTPTALTTADSSVIFNAQASGSRYYVFEGVPCDKYYRCGIAAGRRTENGIQIGTITDVSSWRNVHPRALPLFEGEAGTPNVKIDGTGVWGYTGTKKRAGFGTDGRWMAGEGAIRADETGIFGFAGSPPVMQAGFGTDGKLTAGAGNVQADHDGLRIYNGHISIENEDGTTLLGIGPGNKYGLAHAALLVAAHNSHARLKAVADYVCGPGENDQETINTAIAKAATDYGGGIIGLLEGTYTINDSISIRTNTHLEGQGAATLVQAPAEVPTHFVMIENFGGVGGSANSCSVKRMRVDGKTRLVGGVMLAGTGITLEGLEAANFTQDGAIGAFFSQRVIVRDCYTSNCIMCLFHGTDVTLIGNTLDSRTTVSGAHSRIIGNRIKGLTVESTSAMVADNICRQAGSPAPMGIQVSESANHAIIRGNLCSHNAQSGIAVYADNCVIMGNVCEDNQKGLTASAGILLGDEAVGNNVQGNTCREGAGISGSFKQAYGIRILSGASHNLVTNNDLRNGGTVANLLDESATTTTTPGNRI